MNDNTENAAPVGAPEGERTIQQDNAPKLPQRVPIKAGASPMAFVPTTFDETWRIATMLVKSGLAPRDLQTPERAMVAIMHGLELGLPPMSAIQRIAVINGRPCIWGNAVPAIAQRTGMLEAWDEDLFGEGDDMVARCTVTRRINSESTITKSATFSVADAKKAGLWTTEARVQRKGRNGEMYTKDNDSPWYRFPKRMLQMRARAAFHDLFADAMCGLFVAEELVGRDSDAEMRDVTPPAQPIIHNPLQDDADMERPARDVSDDIAVTGSFKIGDKVTGGPFGSEGGTIVAQNEEEAPDHDPETGEVVDAKMDSDRRDADEPPEAIDNMAGVTGTPATGLAKPADPPKRAAPRPRPKPRQAPTEAAGEPKPSPVVAQPEADKTSPVPNAALSIAFPQPWIKKTGEHYETYLRQWVGAWVEWGQDPGGIRDRYAAERTIRNALSTPMDEEQLKACKAIAMEAFKKLGGVLQ